MPSFEDLPEKEKLIQNVLEMLAEIPEDNLVRYGHQIDDIILSCHFNNMECLYVEFTAFFANKAVDSVLNLLSNLNSSLLRNKSTNYLVALRQNS